MKIYTKKGDRLMTSLYNGARVKKDHDRIQILGQLDEVVARLCYALSLTKRLELQKQGQQIAQQLMKLMSYIAFGSEQFKAEHVNELEQWIDEYTALLPKLNHFILPSNDVLAASLNLCRTAIRETERLYAHSVDLDSFDPVVAQYLNRLSDYTFMLVRYSLYIHDQEEIQMKGIKDE